MVLAGSYPSRQV
jgi:hypothetical protein